MEKLPNWLKWTILIIYWIVAISMFFGGVTAIVGVPLAGFGIVLYNSMKPKVDD